MPDARHDDLARIRAVEERCFNAWPALSTLVVDGWLLRLAEGYTKRANSINAWMPTSLLSSVLPDAERLYAGQCLPCIVRLTPLAPGDSDALLAAAGYARIDDTLVMVLDLGRDTPPADGNVAISARPTDAWCTAYAYANALAPALRDIHDRMLARIVPKAYFASLAASDEMLGLGLAVAERGFVGLFDILTLPAARRQGVARQLIASLLAAAKHEGAHTAYLQVVAANHAAIALYRSMGFVTLYHYHYRVGPSPERT